MFICQISGTQSKPGEKCHKVVVQTRDKVYYKWIKNEETLKWEEVEAGRGTEIVKELNATREGLDLWASWNEEERAAFLKHIN